MVERRYYVRIRFRPWLAHRGAGGSPPISQISVSDNRAYIGIIAGLLDTRYILPYLYPS